MYLRQRNLARATAKPEVVTIGLDKLKQLQLEDVCVIDIREAYEVETGRLPNAHVISLRQLKAWLRDQEVPSDANIVVYCAAGKRSIGAALDLRDAGFRKAVSLEGGIQQWQAAGQPLEGAVELDSAIQERFSRQILLSEVGVQGQVRLTRSRVLVVGAGGLGSPCLYYLAAAGIGTLGVADADVVELSNLHRQILYSVDDLGQSKALIAQSKLCSINPKLNVETYTQPLARDNALMILQGYDLVVDCTDNFDSRYALNDAALEVGIPLIHGAISRYEGTVGVFNLDGGPCYRCVYPEAPPKQLSPSCTAVGVLGVVPGMVGVMQANEALKIILGLQPPASAKLIKLDALTMSLVSVGIAARGRCLCRSFNHGRCHE